MYTHTQMHTTWHKGIAAIGHKGAAASGRKGAGATRHKGVAATGREGAAATGRDVFFIVLFSNEMFQNRPSISSKCVWCFVQRKKSSRFPFIS